MIACVAILEYRAFRAVDLLTIVEGKGWSTVSWQTIAKQRPAAGVIVGAMQSSALIKGLAQPVAPAGQPAARQAVPRSRAVGGAARRRLDRQADGGVRLVVANTASIETQAQQVQLAGLQVLAVGRACCLHAPRPS